METFLSSIFIITLIILSLLSINKRGKSHHYRGNPLEKMYEPSSSAFSEGLMNLIGTAGGIYLSLIAITTFLEIDFPERIKIYGFAMEPLASISFLGAIFQPYFLSIYYFIKGTPRR